MLLQELLAEGFADKLTVNLCDWLRKKFKSEPGIKLEVVPATDTYRKLMDIPSGTNSWIAMTVPGPRHARKSATEYLMQQLGQRFPENNLLGIDVRVIETVFGANIILQKNLDV